MKNIKIYFTSWHFDTASIFLNYLLPMTPNKSGKWKTLEATLNKEEADFFVIFDGHNENLSQEQEKRAIYICQHPKVNNKVYGTDENLSKSFKPYTNKNVFFISNSDTYINSGEWWISKSYDELIGMPIPKKNKELCYIVTYQTHNPMYNQRVLFARELVKHIPQVEIFGRPSEKYNQDSELKPFYKGELGANNPDGSAGEHTKGKDIVANYLRSIEVDVGPTKNYFSERFYDALLMWTKPYYFGSENTSTYFPLGSFEQINILDLSEVKRIKDDLSKPIDYKAIDHARDLLLNKYQTWAYVYNIITEKLNK